MLQREYRFHSRAAVQAVYRRGRSTRSGLLMVKTVQRQTGQLRAAVVVSTKVSKSAPVRNRIRRRIYELIRTQVDLHQSLDMAITVYGDDVASLSSGELQRQFQQLCSQAGINGTYIK